MKEATFLRENSCLFPTSRHDHGSVTKSFRVTGHLSGFSVVAKIISNKVENTSISLYIHNLVTRYVYAIIRRNFLS